MVSALAEDQTATGASWDGLDVVLCEDEGAKLRCGFLVGSVSVNLVDLGWSRLRDLCVCEEANIQITLSLASASESAISALVQLVRF